MIAPPNKNDGRSRRSATLPSGKNGATTRASSLRIAIAVVVAVAAAVGVWWVASRRDAEPQRESGAKKAERPTKRRVEGNAPYQRSRVTRDPTEPEEPAFEVKRYGRSSNVPTTDTNNIHYASQTGLKVTDADGNVRVVRSKPIFKSRADNMLWAAVRPGGMPSGLNALRSRMRFQTGSDEAFLQALRSQEITVEPDDPPHVVNAKKMTMEIKRGIIDELDKGRTFDDIYREICAETKKERMYERIAQEDMRKIVQARDAEAARKYVEEMNPVMREMGLKELRLPSWAQEDAATDEN